MVIQICVGSSCHLKGSEDVVNLFQKAIEDYKLNDDITLAGSFCTGKCNRQGVTVQFDDEIVTGVTTDNFKEILQKYVLSPLDIKEN